MGTNIECINWEPFHRIFTELHLPSDESKVCVESIPLSHTGKESKRYVNRKVTLIKTAGVV